MTRTARSEGLEELLEGNRRFREGGALAPRRDPERRRAVATKQAPWAAVLTCSDSRVSPELLFDQGLGDLFVVRTAGHVLDRGALGSLEYAVEHLGVSLVVVLGHSSCGAVTAAVGGARGPGAVGWVLAAIRPAIQAEAAENADAVDTAAREHARLTAEALEAALSHAAAAGEVRVVPSFYDLVTGKVELL